MARRLFVTVVLIILFVGFGTAGIVAYKTVENRPRKQTGYADLQLGMTVAEAKYVKGYPTYVVGKSEPATGKEFWKQGSLPVFPTKDLPVDRHVEDYDLWSYELNNRDARLDVSFDASTKFISDIACFSTGTMECPPLLGIHEGTSETDVVKMLGKPTHEELDGVAKKITYDNLNAWFYLSKLRVYNFGVRDFSHVARTAP